MWDKTDAGVYFIIWTNGLDMDNISSASGGPLANAPVAARGQVSMPLFTIYRHWAITQEPAEDWWELGKVPTRLKLVKKKKIRKYYESYRNSERLLLNRCKCPDHYKRLLSNINHNGFGISANGRWSQCTSSVCLRRTLTKFVDRRYRYCSAHTHFSSSSSHCLRMPHVSAHYQQTFIFRYAKQTGQPASYIRRKKNLHGNIIQVLLPVGDWHLHAPPLVRRQFCIFSLFVVLCVPTTRQFRYC